ncbi:Ferredoxin subunit of nitrite reductase or a ring-hydroxylating dioxygenase [Halopelagius inordinatus]|uniref:Ferredoxin subunit of nitrite reductase or a ring-hydroxylating dioxygenase n=1 Tax=Halopelagius inordinatus TaxID=553467 RepID=A0A1I2WRW7_9EURY|nr:Ferredoxin subunit of nitrite reductase or a ring-hydroxylating dioxygenase [Halopelagius inordinatus]
MSAGIGLYTVSRRTRLTTVEDVHENGSWLFTVRDRYGEREEVILVPCEESVEAWVNQCMHQPQRLDRGFGAAVRDGQVVCPRHGSAFDTCSGYCDNGEADGTTLVDVDVAVEDGAVYLDDAAYDFDHEGGIDDRDGGDDGPNSSSHISF